MKLDAASTLVDVAFAVCTALERAGTTAVLTGGSAATYFAPDAYQSADIDFVVTFRAAGDADRALLDLGFARRGDYYEHASALFPLEFPPGPLMVGDDLITEWNTEARQEDLLHVLTPSDSCRDRLAAFLYWNDFSGLEQALAVCRAQPDKVDLALVRTWCERERALDKYRLFEQRLDQPD